MKKLGTGGSVQEEILLEGTGSTSLSSANGDLIFLDAQASSPQPCDPYRTMVRNESEETMDPQDSQQSLPASFALLQNHPNPFNPVTQISYTLPEDSRVTLRIYDVLGREIKVLVEEFQEAGRKSVRFESGEFSSGVYFYHLNAGAFSAVRKMLVMK